MPLGAARITLLAFSPAVVAEAEVIRRKVGISAIGNAQVDTARSKFGGSSLYLSGGSGNYLENVDFPALGTGDFTIEWFQNLDILNQSTAYMYLDARPGSNGAYPLIWTQYSNNTVVYYFVDGATRITSATNSLVVDTWQHIAIVRSSGTTTMYIDGSATGTPWSDSTNYLATTRFRIGGNMNGVNSVEGWMDEFRISNTARYTSNFTPSTTPFVNDANTLLLLHMDGTDGSTIFEDDNSVALVGEGVDMNGDNVYADTSISSTVSDGQYLTISLLWKNPSTGLGTIFDWDGGINDGNQTVKDIWVQTDSNLELLVRNVSVGVYAQSETGYADDKWHHGLIVYDAVNNTQAMWIDGKEQTLTVSYSNMSGNIPFSGLDGLIAFGEFYDIDNFRNYPGDVAYFWLDNSYQSDITKFWDYGSNKPKWMGTDGTATGLSQPLIYHYGNTSTFPTNNGTGTGISYSLSTIGTFADSTDKPNYKEIRNLITANGNAQIDTAQSKFGGSSAYFDGNGDGLQLYDFTGIDWNSDFTVELWIYMTAYGEQVFFDTREGSGGNGTGGYLVRDSGSVLRFYLNGTSIVSKSDPNLTTNAWYHVAVTRSGNNFNLWINGTSVSSATSSATGTAYKFYIGRNSYSSTSGNTVGYIDEFRFSNSVRYTANFTPSAAPFQNDSNTLLLLHMDGTDGSTYFPDDNGVTPDYDYGA